MTDDSIVDLVKKHKEHAEDVGEAEMVDLEAVQATDSANEAMTRRAEAMTENIPVDNATEDILARLLEKVKSKMAWVEVNLPSQGILYRNGERTVKIRPFTYEDERMLKNIAVSKKNPDEVIGNLLANCVDGINTADLLPHDRLYILFRLRGISYGDNYPIAHDCTKCETTSKLDLSISTLLTTSLTKEHMVFTLPDSEQEVEIKLPSQKDSHLFSTTDALMENLYQFILRVEDIHDKTIIEAFVRRTTVRDIDTLRTHIFTPDYGMETHFFYNCAQCSTKNRVEIELNESFFTAS